MANHATKRVPREAVDILCDDSSCKFYGESAQQGVCYATDPFYGGRWDYVEAVEKGVLRDFEEERKLHGKTPEEWLAHLEAALICSKNNETFGLDELIRLRKRVREMEHAMKATKN